MFNSAVALVLLFLSGAGAAAQSTQTDSTVNLQRAYAASLFYKALGAQSPLYNGKEYIEVKRTQGHPFFVSDQFATATVYFDRFVFQDVPVLYDIVNDEVILRNYENKIRFVLNPIKLEAFHMHGHHFITIAAGAVKELPPGIYDKLYHGKLLLLAKRRKIINEKVSREVSREPVEKDLYYLVSNGTAHQVRNRRQLLQRFEGKQKEIRDLLRKAKINYRKQPEAALIKVAGHFDQQPATD